MEADIEKVMETYKARFGNYYYNNVPEDILKSYRKDALIEMFKYLQHKYDELENIIDSKDREIISLKGEINTQNDTLKEHKNAFNALTYMMMESDIFPNFMAEFKKDMNDYAELMASRAGEEAEEHANEYCRRSNGIYGYDE